MNALHAWIGVIIGVFPQIWYYWLRLNLDSGVVDDPLILELERIWKLFTTGANLLPLSRPHSDPLMSCQSQPESITPQFSDRPGAEFHERFFAHGTPLEKMNFICRFRGCLDEQWEDMNFGILLTIYLYELDSRSLKL